MVRCLLIVALLCPLALPAQRRPAQPKPAPAQSAAAWPIESIDLEGLHEYSREQVLAVAGLKVGQPVTAKDIDAARQRLTACGVFESVGFKFGPAPDQKGYTVTFQLGEASPMLPVRFEDLGAPDAQLTEALRKSDPLFGPKVPATTPIIKRYTDVLQQFLASQNHPEKIIGKVSMDDAGQTVILFAPAARPTAIARVRFKGNTVAPEAALANAINATAVGMPYRERRFRQLLDTTVRPFYEARGRVRVAFPEIQTEKETGVQGLLVTVMVNEGESYSLGEVNILRNGAPAPDLAEAGKFKSGDVFNVQAVQAGVKGIEKRLGRQGYIHVKSEIERSINDQKKAVNLTIRLDPGPQYLFGKLDIQGLDIVTEPEIRKLWVMKEGQAFNAEYPDYFLERLRADNLFENLGSTKAVSAPDDAARRVNVTLVFGPAAPPPPEKKPEGPSGPPVF